MLILKSASKIAFLLITITICSGFLLKALSEKEFVTLAAMAFSYYFGRIQAQNEKK